MNSIRREYARWLHFFLASVTSFYDHGKWYEEGIKQREGSSIHRSPLLSLSLRNRSRGRPVQILVVISTRTSLRSVFAGVSFAANLSVSCQISRLETFDWKFLLDLSKSRIRIRRYREDWKKNNWSITVTILDLDRTVNYVRRIFSINKLDLSIKLERNQSIRRHTKFARNKIKYLILGKQMAKRTWKLDRWFLKRLKIERGSVHEEITVKTRLYEKRRACNEIIASQST